jgi:hypothetical protein
MARNVSKVIGVFLIISALAGFVSGTQVLIFQVNTAQNIVHLLTGLAAIYFGFTTEQSARTCSAALAAIYGIVGVLGLAGAQPIINRFNLNSADNWMHLICGAVFFGVAFSEMIGIKRYFMGGQTQLPPGGSLQH